LSSLAEVSLYRIRIQLSQNINQWRIHFLWRFRPFSFLRSKNTALKHTQKQSFPTGRHDSDTTALCGLHDSYLHFTFQEQKPDLVNGFASNKQRLTDVIQIAWPYIASSPPRLPTYKSRFTQTVKAMRRQTARKRYNTHS
jgi:hypothetical protein